MDRMLTVKEVSQLWDTPVNQITRYCRENRIAGAKKEGNTWFIPQGAQKPVDGRKSRGAQKVTPTVVKKPLPIGVSSYRDACTHYYYVDKTLLIKDFLNERPKVSLFTRPRRFGKTLNMDMLKTFFEISPEDTSVYFRDKQIWQNMYHRIHFYDEFCFHRKTPTVLLPGLSASIWFYKNILWEVLDS